jgi:hypothetical protein
VAAHLLCVDNHLPDRAASRIEKSFDLNRAKSALCKPFPDAEPVPAEIDEIVAALPEGGEVLRQVGHNAIFAMLSIKAFRMLPTAATPQRIDETGHRECGRGLRSWTIPDAEEPRQHSPSERAGRPEIDCCQCGTPRRGFSLVAVTRPAPGCFSDTL